MSSEAPIDGDANLHNILTIPPELFERIAQEADHHDLLSLRMVSRETNQKAFRTFLAVHFTERAFLLSSLESLHTLLLISKNEPLARSLRRIDLCIEETPARDHIIHRLPYMLQTEATEFETSELEMNPKQESNWDDIIQTQEAVSGCDLDLFVLTVAFARLRRSPNLKEIGVVDCAEACETPRHFDTLEKLSGQNMIFREEGERGVPLVLNAMALSFLQVESFVVHFDNYYVDLNAMIKEPMALSNTITTFSRLKKLHLQIGYTSLSATVEAVDKSFEALSKAFVVEDLSLDLAYRFSYPGFSPSIYERIMQRTRQCLKTGFPKLKYLDLQGFDIPYKDLKEIMPHLGKLTWLHVHSNCRGCRADEREHDHMREEDLDSNGQFVTRSQMVHALADWKKDYSSDVASCTMMEWLEGNEV